jgi:hypothetical protein
MSSWNPGKAECGVDSFYFARRRSDGARGEESSSAASIGLRSFIFRIANFNVLCALAFVCWGSESSLAQQPDFGIYARAVAYCRGNVERPMALDPDKRVLCFDGAISPGQDVSLAKGLQEKGLFVVRSPGGDVGTAFSLADLLQDRHATVVVYDYCILDCASYLLFASEQTFVLKNSLVAWHYPIDPHWCPSLAMAKDGGPKRLQIAPCSSAAADYQDGYKRFLDISRDFYAARGADPLVEWPPQSVFVRKTLGRKFEGTGRVPDFYWTWNPRHIASAIKTKIVYEAYPQTQDELDAIAARISFYHPVIYDL